MDARAGIVVVHAAQRPVFKVQHWPAATFKLASPQFKRIGSWVTIGTSTRMCSRQW